MNPQQRLKLKKKKVGNILNKVRNNLIDYLDPNNVAELHKKYQHNLTKI